MDTAPDAPIPPPNRPALRRPARRRLAGATIPALAVMAVLAATPALADTPPEQIALENPVPSETSLWRRSFYKLLTYETMANASDVVILSALSGGIGSVGTGFLVANVATAATVYYGHEIAWGLLGPPPDEHTALTTGAKATTYRFLSVSRSFGLAYVLAGSTEIATSFALIGNVADTIIYIGNEWAWNTFSPYVATPPVRP